MSTQPCHFSGNKRQVLNSSVLCGEDCWHSGLSHLKALAVTLSQSFGGHGLFGSQPQRLKAQ